MQYVCLKFRYVSAGMQKGAKKCPRVRMHQLLPSGNLKGFARITIKTSLGKFEMGLVLFYWDV